MLFNSIEFFLFLQCLNAVETRYNDKTD